MNEFFKSLTDCQPYDYQLKMVSECLSNRKNLFLCAPTGAGKTWAALFPYMWAKKERLEFVDRLIYVLPLRTLATSLYKSTVDDCKKVFNVKNNPDERINESNELIITIQTGEQKGDPFFEGDIIFTTIDQCLSSYINMPVSLPKRIGNINAGALLGSLIILDEFHLLEPDKAMGTTIEMLSRLKPFAQFIMMTATLSANSMNLLKEILGGEIIRLTRDEVILLPSHKGKKRAYRWINRPLNVDNIIRFHGNKRSIVVVNTVSRAQKIFVELQERIKGSKTKIFLLHSRFYREDRKKTEDKLKYWFGKKASDTDVILVTTQVVEAGMDISADNLHTELAPLNSLVQRAGRCARYEGERGIGTVCIYELEVDKKGNPKVKPYDNKIVSVTRDVLEQLTQEGEFLDFEAELDLLDQVHSEQETSFLELYNRNEYALRNSINEAMDGHSKAAVRELIRDISSVNVIISNNPYSLKFDKEKWPRMLSVPRTSLYSLAPFFEESSGFGETVAWYPVEDTNIIDDETDLSFGWHPVSAKEDFNNISWLIVINPQFAAYSPTVGLQIGISGQYEEPKDLDRPLIPRYKIHYETYQEHIQKVVSQCTAMNNAYVNTTKRLANHFAISLSQVENFTEMACTFHDVGKLAIKWQKAVREWQKYKNPDKLNVTPIAHSDYNPETDFEKKKGFLRQPNHAAEGAYAIMDLLVDWFGEYAIVLYSAITRHHGAFTESLREFKLIENSWQWIKETLQSDNRRKIILNGPPDIDIQRQFKDSLLCFSKNSEDEKLWPLYVYLARRLRLADQKSQKGRE